MSLFFFFFLCPPLGFRKIQAVNEAVQEIQVQVNLPPKLLHGSRVYLLLATTDYDDCIHMMGVAGGIQVRILSWVNVCSGNYLFLCPVASEVLYQNNTEGTLQTNWLGKNGHVQMEQSGVISRG